MASIDRLKTNRLGWIVGTKPVERDKEVRILDLPRKHPHRRAARLSLLCGKHRVALSDGDIATILVALKEPRP